METATCRWLFGWGCWRSASDTPTGKSQSEKSHAQQRQDAGFWHLLLNRPKFRKIDLFACTGHSGNRELCPEQEIACVIRQHHVRGISDKVRLAAAAVVVDL